MNFERIKCSDKTDALLKAMEMADDCDTILVLYQKNEANGSGQGFIHVGENTLGNLNWMVDRFQLWLLGPLRDDGEEI